MQYTVLFTLYLFDSMTVLSLLAAKIAAGICLSGLFYNSYVGLPQELLYGSESPLLPKFDHDDVFLIFPGFGGVDLNTKRIEEEVIKSDKKYLSRRFIYTYDWSKWRGNTVRAAFDSQMVGKRIGKDLAERAILRRKAFHELHVVGVSVGAFAADECIKEYVQTIQRADKDHVILDKSTHRPRTKTRLSLLDPFTSRGIFGQGYGAANFGKTSDFCEHFVNTDDPVPFTNDPLPHAFNYDITNSVERQSFTPLPGDNMHSWPTAYYGLFWRDRIDPRAKSSSFGQSHDDHHRRGHSMKL